MSPVLTTSERERCFVRYATAADDLETAYYATPERARLWRLAPGEWSVHENVIHCADVEVISASRFRLLAVEPEPMLVTHDQDSMAKLFDYHARSIEVAFAQIRAMRAFALPIMQSLPDDIWRNVGRHAESGPYAMSDWLRYWSEHHQGHAEQIRATVTLFLEHNATD